MKYEFTVDKEHAKVTMHCNQQIADTGEPCEYGWTVQVCKHGEVYAVHEFDVKREEHDEWHDRKNRAWLKEQDKLQAIDFVVQAFDVANAVGR